jgi:DNA-binding response OmpR family regulator
MAHKVLIVDDDPAIQMAYARMLGSAGYAVTLANDAVGAVSAAVRERPDVVVLDLGLPAGNGTLVLQRMRNLPNTSITPVVVVTGRAPALDEALQLQELGCEAILVKPVRAEELVDAVGHALAVPVDANDAAELH